MNFIFNLVIKEKVSPKNTLFTQAYYILIDFLKKSNLSSNIEGFLNCQNKTIPKNTLFTLDFL